MSHFVSLGPLESNKLLDIPWIPEIPEPVGRKLPNGTIIVAPNATPSLLYKFTPWENSSLARSEIEIYSVFNRITNLSGIVRLEGVSATADHLVRVMERSGMGSLETALRCNGREEVVVIDREHAQIILAQIAGTMAQIHSTGVVHRDLKAENILMFEDADYETAVSCNLWAKVSDFDRSVLLPEGLVLTEPVGSLFHMAPELLAGKEYDRRVDIYAFGILMFEVMHDGARPYSNVATGMPGSLPRAEFASKVVNETYRPVWRDQDDDLRRLAERCWATDPASRPEFTEILQTLKPVSGPHRTFRKVYETCQTSKPIDALGVAATIGRVRRTMEDASSIVSTGDTLICGVFDGLRGSAISELASWQVPLTIANKLDRACVDNATAIRDVFSRTQATLRRLEAGQQSGSTATVLLAHKNELLIAWLGDSPAWLFRTPSEDVEPEALSLIRAHHPDRNDEAIRLTACGAEVRREQRMLDSGELVPWGPFRTFSPEKNHLGGIALSRALGLTSYGTAISQEPEIVLLERQANEIFIVLGSDGLSDVLTTQDIYELLLSSISAQDAADAIIEAALDAGAPDNASIIVVDLRSQTTLR